MPSIPVGYLLRLAVCALCNGFFVALRGPLLPLLSKHLEMSVQFVGSILFLSQGAAGAIAAVPLGLLLERGKNPRIVLAVGLIVRACVALLPFVYNLPYFTVVSVVLGMTLPAIGVSLRSLLCLEEKENAVFG